MAVFDVSFLNPSIQKPLQGEGGVSVLFNEITILENQLKKDGYLAQSDYDLLMDKTRELELNSSLSATQRSRAATLTSSYESRKGTEQHTRNENVDEMDNALKSEGYEDILLVGNDPKKFLEGRASSLQAKLEQLQESITRRESTGQDTSGLMNEYQESMTELSDRYGALDGMAASDGQNPIDGYAAYMTTNSRGEIVDVDYAKFGSKSGFAETNGMIDGFQVFGKPNKKEGGKNVFILGNERFSGTDMMETDPLNPGSFKPTKMISESMQSGGIFSTGKQGFLNVPGVELTTQSYIPKNTWGKGVDGTLYERLEEGGYRKYINTTPEDVNIDASRILALPKQFEDGIMRQVTDSVDSANPISPDQGSFGSEPGLSFGGAPGEPQDIGPGDGAQQQAAQQQQQGPPANEQIRNRASAPTERSSTNFFQNAKKTAQAAASKIGESFGNIIRS